MTATKPIKKILIANRGEIAVRVIRAAKELGIQTVAVFSDADQFSLHVKLADFAVRLPGNTSAETYLNVPVLVKAIKESQADAVHPGYGFLSENADFVDAVTMAGAKFIGPSAKAMRLMGDKIAAKRLMKEHKVPCTPGSEGPLKDLNDLQNHAKTVGYPMILKATAGGGGRGMRVVRTDADLAEAFAACTREAISYFGNPAVFCEKYIENPRHIEVQVLFDEQGNGVHLFERDCSVQRRHQKLIEEAPSSYLSHDQRMEIGRRAVTAAKAAGYASAGTIEFICESPDHVYFMEMNTRIQVEHTVSEEITNIDLVKWQIRVAQGEVLSMKQEDIKLRGWAIEARINAEDPAKGFLPSPGVVSSVRFPSGPGIRIESHLYPGYEIPQYYDSMVAKLIVWGEDRKTAMARLNRALGEFEIAGVPTTAKFHEAVLRHPIFIDGKMTTSFVEKEADFFKQEFLKVQSEDVDVAALLAAVFAADDQNLSQSGTLANSDSVGLRSRWFDSARHV
ncbi:MAG: acetyl-CoA carboxylase biotin carboxylase subunit [Proteobacteria bacterium]|nr:acetyl-CoA carboxylase biotin carboxylase subunit [Pseudomonadota bacterium]